LFWLVACIPAVLLGVAWWSQRPPQIHIDATPVATTSTTTTVGPASTLSPSTTPARRDPVDVVVIGDSYSTQANPWHGRVFETMVAAGEVVLTVDAIGGTGYVNGATERISFFERAGDLAPDTDLVVFFGSLNDVHHPADQVGRTAASTFELVAATAPGAGLVVIGPPTVVPDRFDAMSAIRDELAIVAATAGAEFIDPIAEGWFIGADARFISADGIHPTPSGQSYIADRVQDRLLQSVEAASRASAG
jgi:lysophospholipase L1-like esterase